MERSKLLRADYLDILFDGRNKLYGGYELRRKYAARARKAMTIVIMGAAIAVTLPVIAAKLSPDKNIGLLPVTGDNILTDVHMVKPEIPPVALPEPPAVKVTQEFPVLKIVRNEEVTEPPTAVEDLSGKAIGLHTNDGTPDGVMPDLGGPVGRGHDIVEDSIAAKEKPYVFVEQMPVFNGDLQQYLNEHLRYPEDAREREEQGRVGIRFVVNEDGSISDVEVPYKATALLDAEAMRVVRSMPRWKPGRQGGTAVKVYFTLPITFRLD